MSLSFFWHDYETFGIDTRRDAPAQFAGIRTDENLEAVGEPLMLYCQPPRDALPHPQSCLITGLTPQVCLEQGVPEAAFAQRVHQELSTPGTIGVGYNSIKFDDEVTRHLLWRNLRDPYGREWQNECSRWDLFGVVRCVYALRPDTLNWPTVEGRHSLKLEHLSAANGLAHANAHDALSDVRATIELARLIRQRQPRLWDYCLSLRHKRAVGDVLGDPAVRRKPVLHVSGMVPQERGHLAMVLPLAWHPHQSGELIVWDLAEDPMELLELDAATIRLRLFTRQADLPPGVRRLPIKTIRLNQSPVVVAALGTLSAERAQELGIDVEIQKQRAAAVQAQAAAFDALDWRAVYERSYPVEALDAEQRLYGGAFLEREDRRLLDGAPLLDPQALSHWRPAFQDERLADLLLRYRARNWPQTLDANERAQWQAHCQARLHEGRGGFMNLQAYQDLIDQLAETADDAQQAVLEALVDWGEAIAHESLEM